MRATRILQDHRVELNRLAEALLEHENLLRMKLFQYVEVKIGSIFVIRIKERR